jgi:hypothetical protein
VARRSARGPSLQDALAGIDPPAATYLQAGTDRYSNSSALPPVWRPLAGATEMALLVGSGACTGRVGDVRAIIRLEDHLAHQRGRARDE